MVSTDLGGWWGMGNHDSLVTGNSGTGPALADSGTVIYDRSRAGTTTNGTFGGTSAPVVLNTTTPLCEAISIGILFTPAPALPMQSN